jgi:proteic killer suppression protein
MIKTFRNNGLQLFFETGNTRRLAAATQARRIRMILDALNAATKPGDMGLPGFRFHPLGDMAPGRYSVRVNGNYRITFAWNDGAIDVDLEDYH